jgi:hypothetical protein
LKFWGNIKKSNEKASVETLTTSLDQVEDRLLGLEDKVDELE